MTSTTNVRYKLIIVNLKLNICEAHIVIPDSYLTINRYKLLK